jgi:protease I
MKKILLVANIMMFLLLPVILFTGIPSEGNEGKLKGKKIVMIIAERMFHDLEYKEPKEIFELEGAIITIASTTLSEAVGMGMYGLKVKPDILIEDIKANNFDAVVIVGGPGALQYLSDRQVHKIAKQALDQGKMLAAIGFAPEILANAGILKGKKATAYRSYSIKSKGAIVTEMNIERDGNIITARSQGDAIKFGEEIVSALIE